MIIGVGIDIIEVERIRSSYEKFGQRFLQRIFLPGETDYCFTFKFPAPHLAARFAAKEAVSKAFGTGIGRKLGWKDIEIARRESGEPYVILREGGQALMQERQANSLLVSLSHTQTYATALAVLEASS